MKVIDITPKIEKRDKIRLAPYCRVSSDSTDQLNSFAAQIRYYSEYVKEHLEYQLVDIYADEGLSGTDLSKREEQLRLIADCKKGLVDRIITKSISRFARNTLELLEMLRLLKENGVSVFFEEQGIDTEKMNMEMIVTFPGMAAQQESEAISGNMRWSYKKRMESGEFNCTCPAFGYYWKEKELCIKEDEAIIVRRIFNLYLKGMGMQEIANLFNEERIPKRYGNNRWRQTTINYILTNERYMGDALLQKKYTTDTMPFKKKYNNGEKPQYYVENSNPPIVSRGTFEKVQKLLAMKRVARGSKGRFVLSGKLRCPDCGGVFRRQADGDKVYWSCVKRTTGVSECKRRRVREEEVYDAFIRLIYKLKVYESTILDVAIAQMRKLSDVRRKNGGEIMQLDKQISDCAAQNLVLTRLHNNGILAAAEYAEKEAELAKQMNSFRERKSRLMVEEKEEDYEEQFILKEAIQECSLKASMDRELFGDIVKAIIVEDGSSLRFQLIGGLDFREYIDEKMRCKSV